MIDWTKPLQTRDGKPAKVLHEFYNGVQTMMVVAIDRGPTCSVPGSKSVEIIKIYDQRYGMDQTGGERPSALKRNNWDLEEVPPPDREFFIYCDDTQPVFVDGPRSGPTTNVPKTAFNLKVVIDGRTQKPRSVAIV